MTYKFTEQVWFHNLYSESKYSQLHVEWIIENPIEFLSTEKQFLSNNADAKGFQFKMLTGKSEDIEIYYLYPISLYIDIVLYRYTNSSDKKKYNPITIKEIECFKANKPNEWHFLASISESDLWFHYQLRDGRFIFRIDVKIYRELLYKRPKISKSQLSVDFGNMLENETYSDLVMTSVDEQEFNVHKVILTNRCEVIKILLENDSIESPIDYIESPCVGDVLKELLRFIYTDKANVESLSQELLVAADYYQLVRLKNLCEDVLISKLSLENVIETLQLADLHSADDLKLEALDFIKRNGLKYIKETESWTNFNSPHLIKRICEDIEFCDCQELIEIITP